MRLAILDLGTNSVRFDVVALGESGEVVKLHREKLMIRLGDKVFLKRRLDPHAIRVCLEAFDSFKRTIADFGVDRVVAFGTSALREANDGERLIARIKKRTGIGVRIVSGDEEARLIARGVLANERSLLGKFALVDIGGGSTEVSICSGRRVIKGASFPLGTARLQQVFLKSIPPAGKSQQAIDQLRRHIRGILLYRLVSEEWPKVSRILGSSGTIRALTRISKRETDSDVIERKYLDELVQRMSEMNREELMAIPGMELRRVDMILAGAILLQECMNAVHAQRAELTEFSLRDGILDEQIEAFKERPLHNGHRYLSNVFRQLRGLGMDTAELKVSQKMAEEVFDRMKDIHALKPEWRIYLVLAALLSRSGRAVSPIKFEFHSAYIANFVDCAGMQDWERQLLSELCLRHRGGRFLKRDLGFKKNERLNKVFYKILALLRLSDALSIQRSRPIRIEKLSLKGRDVKLFVSKRYFPDLAVLRADQKRYLFDEVFNKRLTIELL